VIADWLYDDNLAPFLTVLCWLTDYDVAPDELAIIKDGVRETDAEKNHWYDYEFVGKQLVKFSLAADPGTSVVHVRIQSPIDLRPKIETAIAIFARFRMQPSA